MNRKEKLVSMRWIPSASRKVAHPDGEKLGVVYIGDAPGLFTVLAYRGSAKNHEFHFSYRTEEEVNKKVAQFFSGITSHKAYVAERREKHKAAEEAPIKSGDYVSVARTAKLIRAQLAKKFPEVKFSVRSNSYSLGASIDIDWVDGPAKDEVQKVTGAFSGSGFDGMIDMRFSEQSWLLPDGSAAFGRSSGTEGSRGVYPAYDHPKPHPDAVLIHFGADHVFLHRKDSAKEAVA